mgnify:FL=1
MPLQSQKSNFLAVSFCQNSPSQAFSADQYNAMLTPQVQAISRAKRDSLTTEQQDAIRSVLASDPDEEDPWGPDDDDYCQGKSMCSGWRGTAWVINFQNAIPKRVLVRNDLCINHWLRKWNWYSFGFFRPKTRSEMEATGSYDTCVVCLISTYKRFGEFKLKRRRWLLWYEELSRTQLASQCFFLLIP